MFLLDGEIEYVQEGGGGGGGGGGAPPAAACVTVNARLAIVSVPVREAPVFAATLNPTEPLAVPAAPDVIVIQEALLTAVHAHPLPADTATVPGPPVAPALKLTGAIAYVHGVGGGGGVTIPDA